MNKIDLMSKRWVSWLFTLDSTVLWVSIHEEKNETMIAVSEAENVIVYTLDHGSWSYKEDAAFGMTVIEMYSFPFLQNTIEILEQVALTLLFWRDFFFHLEQQTFGILNSLFFF